ncbi:MAG: dipeptide epimerase [Xanthomonadales bacterium]|nr:dipeptide epimerase [Xanthomonadales bacterium]
MPTVTMNTEQWHFETPFEITGYSWTGIGTLYVEIQDGEYVGRGEATGVYYTDESADSMLQQAESIRADLEKGISREELLDLLPSGGARNAVDAALWDLEAKQSGKSVWDMAGIDPAETITVATVGLDTPEGMAAAAKRLPSTKIKIKVSGDDPVTRIAAIREARPDADLVIDANQGWTFEQLVEVAPRLQELGVVMIEQPLPRGDDAELAGYQCPIPLCADESCLDMTELDQAAGRYDMINIKLDKVGGLTAGLNLAYKAKSMGLGLMVGNMAGTSLGMAPGFVLAQLCDLVDLDGPMLLTEDRDYPLHYDNGVVSGLTPALWG